MKTLRFKFHFWSRGLIALYVLFMGCCRPMPYQPDYIMAEVESEEGEVLGLNLECGD